MYGIVHIFNSAVFVSVTPNMDRTDTNIMYLYTPLLHSLSLVCAADDTYHPLGHEVGMYVCPVRVTAGVVMSNQIELNQIKSNQVE